MNQPFTKSKRLRIKNIESLVFDDFLSKTQKISVFLLPLNISFCIFNLIIGDNHLFQLLNQFNI